MAQLYTHENKHKFARVLATVAGGRELRNNQPKPTSENKDATCKQSKQ